MRRRGWGRPGTALALVLAGCGTSGASPAVPGMPPVCDPPPWSADALPRLRAPFDVSDDPGVAAAGLSAVPHLLNEAEVQSALVEEFIPLVMESDQVPEGTIGHWLRVGVDGRVEGVELQESSGVAEIDEAAGRVVRTLELTPAVRGGCRVAVWVFYPIRLQARVADSG